jgi:hypothetical protein
MSVRSVRLARLVICLALPLAACVAPARSPEAYEGKAGASAQSMHSTVQTARLAVTLAASGKATAPYLSEMLHYAEDDATFIEGSFRSIQPPDAASDRLRSELGADLSTAVDTIERLRIAARRGNVSALPDIAAPLAWVAASLETFASQHTPGGTV